MSSIDFDGIRREVQAFLASADVAHDFAHIERVLRNAELLAEDIAADMDFLRLICLLHDVDDRKVTGGNTHNARDVMLRNGVSEAVCRKVEEEIDRISFSKHTVPVTTEGRIAQDADRLDAIGAIGIARAFSYGGDKGMPIYGADGGDTVSHFYDKLLKLRDLMNFPLSKRIADERTRFMEQFLDRLRREADF